MIDISLFLSLGLAGVIITIILCVTGKKKKLEPPDDPGFAYIKIFSITVSIIVVLYVFRLLMMFSTGMFSGAHASALVGGLVALIPLFLIGLTRYTKKSKPKV